MLQVMKQVFHDKWRYFPLIVLNHDVERIILLSELTQKNVFDPFFPSQG